MASFGVIFAGALLYTIYKVSQMGVLGEGPTTCKYKGMGTETTLDYARKIGLEGMVAEMVNLPGDNTNYGQLAYAKMKTEFNEGQRVSRTGENPEKFFATKS